jgi:hypothetical protein
MENAMDRKSFLGIAAMFAAAPALACEQSGGSRQREQIVITVHKDPG